MFSFREKSGIGVFCLNLASTMAQQQAGVIAAQKAAEQAVSDAKWGAAGSIAGGAFAGYYGKMNKPGVNPSKPMRDPNGLWIDV